MDCVICNKESISQNHVCTNKAEAFFRRRLSAKAAADTRRSMRRYGCGDTVGDRIAVGFMILQGRDVA